MQAICSPQRVKALASVAGDNETRRLARLNVKTKKEAKFEKQVVARRGR